MPTLSEAFLPATWDECERAIAQRDQNVAHLRAQGFVCTCHTFYRITDGMPVYVVDATSPDTELRREREYRPKTRSRHLPDPKRSPGSLDGLFPPKTLGYEKP